MAGSFEEAFAISHRQMREESWVRDNGFQQIGGSADLSGEIDRNCGLTVRGWFSDVGRLAVKVMTV